MAILYVDSASFNNITVTGSLAATASWATTASFALATAGGAAFPFTGSAVISGSLAITGSTATVAPLAVSSGSTSLLYVSGGGNVGIGTSSPATRLHSRALTTSTNTTVESTRLEISSTGTTAASFGQALNFYGRVQTTDNLRYAYINTDFRFMTSPSNQFGGRMYIGIVNNGTDITNLSLDGNGGGSVYSNVSTVISATLGVNGQIRTTTGGTGATFYRTGSGGADLTANAFFGATSTVNAGDRSIALDSTNNNGIIFVEGNGSQRVGRASINGISTSNTAGAEAGDLVFYTKPSASAVTERVRIVSDSRVTYTSLFTATASSQSYFLITGSIQQFQTASAQIYGINIAPTMIYTTGSQTSTALKVMPWFSGSNAISSSQQNLIADFGANTVGTQFSVNDVTSGSIYMVNDVSGLPIIEALSDWTVNMYNYPTKVFQKTGSAVIISGSLTVTSGSITMPSRPAFRVVGATTNAIPAGTTISGSLATVDYNQGGFYNNTNGVFTASLAGLYHVFLNMRTNAGATQQAIVYRNATTASFMWEATGSFNGHFGVSGILNLVANDNLRVTATVGNVQFDSNDSWGVAYIG